MSKQTLRNCCLGMSGEKWTIITFYHWQACLSLFWLLVVQVSIVLLWEQKALWLPQFGTHKANLAVFKNPGNNFKQLKITHLTTRSLNNFKHLKLLILTTRSLKIFGSLMKNRGFSIDGLAVWDLQPKKLKLHKTSPTCHTGTNYVASSQTTYIIILSDKVQ